MTFDEINCSRCIELLDNYRKGNLSSEEMARMDSHLAECRSCAAELRFRELLSAELKTVRANEVPSRLSPAVMNAIANSQNRRQTVPQTSPLLPWMLAAAVVILVFVAMYQVRMPEHLATRNVAMNRQYKGKQSVTEENAVTRRVPVQTQRALMQVKDELAQKTPAPESDKAESSNAAIITDSQEAEAAAAPALASTSLSKAAPARALSDSPTADKAMPPSTMAGAQLGYSRREDFEAKENRTARESPAQPSASTDTHLQFGQATVQKQAQGRLYSQPDQKSKLLLEAATTASLTSGTLATTATETLTTDTRSTQTQ